MDARTKALIDAVAAKRTSSGLSLRRLASVTGVSFSTLARLEREEVEPDHNTVARLVSWLGDDVKHLDLDVDYVAKVHFRASKNIDPLTIRSLVRVALQIQKDGIT